MDNPADSTLSLPRPLTFRAADVPDFNRCRLGRNTFFRDGQKVVDLGISKYFQMPFEGHQFMLRADLFNAFTMFGMTSLSTTFKALTSGVSQNQSPFTRRALFKSRCGTTLIGCCASTGLYVNRNRSGCLVRLATLATVLPLGCSRRHARRMRSQLIIADTEK